MSTEAKNIRSFGIDLVVSLSGSISEGVATVAKIFRSGAQQPAQAAAADTVNVGEDTQPWFASIVGAFDNDPIYARIIENINENRRRLAAEYDVVE